jgi:predicted nucleic acid-binding protein
MILIDTSVWIDHLERHKLAGRGIGYVDAHLLAAVAIDAPARLWTRDKRLRAIAEELGLGHAEPAH